MASRKMPCELVVFELLPTARGSIAKILVDDYGYTQSKVAELFGVTNVAISQYVKGLRGGNKYIDESSHKDEFYEKIEEIARRLDKEGSDLSVELCDLCAFFKDSGMINEIYLNQGSKMPLTKCGECPRKNL
ncbi:MAG: transcriptional regulator [Candidatus Methanomethylophilaceae archaeon]|jgi:predicted transcriptional regulator|nr:transcriptional regulator [Candidatus Methanomethylophilaceae archaeon]